jgi:hypothetical protein
MLTMIEDPSNPWNAYSDYWGPFSIVVEGGIADKNSQDPAPLQTGNAKKQQIVETKPPRFRTCTSR